jgi:YggT family protein
MLLTSTTITIIALILRIISFIINLYSLLIVVNALLSWVPALYQSKFGYVIAKIVDPYLSLFRIGPFRKLAMATGIDFSPIIALIVLYFIQDIVINQWLVSILARLVA